MLINNKILPTIDKMLLLEKVIENCKSLDHNDEAIISRLLDKSVFTYQQIKETFLENSKLTIIETAKNHLLWESKLRTNGE